MTIAKADILVSVNKICKRAETDIDNILLEAMEEISRRTGAIPALATGTTTANQEYVAAPTDLAGNLIHSIYLGTDRPLGILTWTQYLNNNYYSGYCLYKDRIYLRPTPGDSTTQYNLEYSKIDDDVDNIELPDDFKPALTRLTAAKLYEKYERYDEVEKQITLFERLLRQLQGHRPTAPVCQYNGQGM